MVTTGNLIDNSHVNPLINTLDKVNSLNPQELKEHYKQALLNSRISDKGGAGLGFIDLVKKTGNKIQYSVKKVNKRIFIFGNRV